MDARGGVRSIGLIINGAIACALSVYRNHVSGHEVLCTILNTVADKDREFITACVTAHIVCGVIVARIVAVAVDDPFCDRQRHGNKLVGIAVGRAVKALGCHDLAGGDVLLAAE